MAHELTIRRNGTVEMAYVGEKPWHGLGTKMQPGATIDEWIAGAGMDWHVAQAPVAYTHAGTDYIVADRVVNHRSDTGMPLGVVSQGYQPFQPREVIEFFRDLIEGIGLTMSTAGTLFDGRRFWATGYIGEQAVLDRRDTLRGYLLLCTSADGSMATTGRFTSVRVVCNNTLRMAHEDDEGIRVLHSRRFDAIEAKNKLGVAPRTFEAFMTDVRKLAAKPVSELAGRALTTELLEREDGPIHDRIMRLFFGDATGSDLEGSGGTAWGWLNSVTQWADHDKKAKSDSHRLNTSLFGSADELKSRALGLALVA